MPIRAVTFDYWNTLVAEDPTILSRRVAAWIEVLADAGHPVGEEALEQAFAAGWKAYVKAWKANQPWGARDSVPVMLESLGVTADEDLFERFVQIFVEPPNDRYPQLNPNVVECLTTLRSAGVRVGIICDVGLSPSPVLRRYLEQQDALHLFDHWSFSDEVGAFKPDAAIFEHALAGLGGIAPRDAAHVGDLRRTDIAGALAMGMTAVRYIGVNDDPPLGTDGAEVEGHHVLADHADLPAALGLS